MQCRDYDGNNYRTIRIGNQLWMAENLRTKHFRNGDPIPNGTGVGDYSMETAPEYQFSYNDDENNANVYGRLYTWYAVTDSRKLSPKGWHIPTLAEWNQLKLYLGMNPMDTDLVYDTSNNLGGLLKENGTEHWLTPNKGATNATGFTALPSGLRRQAGTFNDLQHVTYIWAPDAYDLENAWYNAMSNYHSAVVLTRANKKNGFAVRCVKDN